MSLLVLDVFKAWPRHFQLPSLADNFSSHAEQNESESFPEII